MHHYITGGVNRLRANRVESLSTSRESTLVGCIGYVYAHFCYVLGNITSKLASCTIQ